MVKKIVSAEYGIAFLAILFLYMHLDFSLWLFILLLFIPDITLLGYAFNTRWGAVIYNIGHSAVIPIVLYVISISSTNSLLQMLVLIWLAHIAMDRCLGYGLKYENSFKETHIQKL